MTMTLVSTVTVGAGGAASISFTGIPATATDLLFFFSGRSSANEDQLQISFNGSTSGYSGIRLIGNGSTTASNAFGYSFYALAPSAATANTFSNASFYIPNYASSANKSVSFDGVYENNGTQAYQSINAELWSNTAAINSITITGNSGNFVQYSTASLYTITKGSGGATVA